MKYVWNGWNQPCSQIENNMGFIKRHVGTTPLKNRTLYLYSWHFYLRWQKCTHINALGLRSNNWGNSVTKCKIQTTHLDKQLWSISQCFVCKLYFSQKIAPTSCWAAFTSKAPWWSHKGDKCGGWATWLWNRVMRSSNVSGMPLMTGGRSSCCSG